MSENQIKFNSLYPHAFFIDTQLRNNLPDYLRSKGWITSHEKILHMEKPGEGNMNFVYRVTTNARSLIVKQSRPWVEKYPQLEAPIERIDVEALFYQLIDRKSRTSAFYASTHWV
jgi:5-methylthioribose kinase